MEELSGQIKKFVTQQKELLRLEQEAEHAQQAALFSSFSPSQLQRYGVALLNLVVGSTCVGLGGKIIVEFTRYSGIPFDSHLFKVGDVVRIDQTEMKEDVKLASFDSNANKVQGVIYRVKEESILVACKEALPNEWSKKLRLFKLVNEVSMQRMIKGLDELSQITTTLSSAILPFSVLSAAFSVQDPINSINESMQDLKLNLAQAAFYNHRLNESQKMAVKMCLSTPDLGLIHGPPGTGKTETLVELIKQLCKPLKDNLQSNMKAQKVLVCGPSNLSVDNLVERLGGFCKQTDFKIVRLGHPAKLLESVVAFSIDNILSKEDSYQLAKDIKKEIEQHLAQLSSAKVGFAEQRKIYREIKELRKEVKVRERQAIDELFKTTNVVLCTLNLAGSSQLRAQKFDICIIDEGSQALEAECWLAGLKVKRLIIAGDHLQLPPTITSPEAAERGLGNTLFERLVKKWPKKTYLLTIQYRMNQIIMKWSSDEFYSGQLVAAPMVKDHILSELTNVKAIEETQHPLWFLDTAGMEMNETIGRDDHADGEKCSKPHNSFAFKSPNDESKYNQGEARLAIEHVAKLLEAGLDPKHVAIIAPYSAQVSLIRRLLEEKFSSHVSKTIEIGSVDSFQGREKDAIVISMVRSNSDGEIGFLKETRRTNVAITRARRHVCIIGDSDTLGRCQFYKRLIAYAEKYGITDYPTT